MHGNHGDVFSSQDLENLFFSYEVLMSISTGDAMASFGAGKSSMDRVDLPLTLHACQIDSFSS